MRFLLSFFLVGAATLHAESEINFSIQGRTYALTGGYAVISQKNGHAQIMIAARDANAKAQIAITAELAGPQLDQTIEVSTEYNPISAIIVNPHGIYSVVPQVSLARDDFMRYTVREEVNTGDMEDDPTDRLHERAAECRHGFTAACRKHLHDKGAKRQKIKVVYKKQPPTWVGKSRAERVKTGDGIIQEKKYRDTYFTLRLTPVMLANKVVSVSGSFGGVVLFNAGMNQGVRMPIQNGSFSLQVKYVP
jgi:hypothetical protein